MSIADLELVSADVLADLSALEPLARQIFGNGQRPQGWFERKLHREAVSPAASRLAVRSHRDPTDAAQWLGYGLLGLPPSLPGVARTAGIGLRQSARGRGSGARLLHALKAAAREHGCGTLEVPASAESTGFYRKVGLQEHRRVGTWLAFGRSGLASARAAAMQPARSWATPPAGIVLSAWLAEAWDRTPPAARYRWHDHQQTLDVSREGVAHLVHRWASAEAPTHAAAALDSWLHTLPSGTPALLANVPQNDPAAPLVRALEASGWVCVQTSVSMRGST